MKKRFLITAVAGFVLFCTSSCQPKGHPDCGAYGNVDHDVEESDLAFR